MTNLTGPTTVSVRNCTVSFLRWGQRVRALDDVSIDVFPGEWVLIVGHNGAGKSTLLKAIGGQLQLDAGDVTISGRPIRTLTTRDLAASVFMVHQDPLLGTAPLMTVFENLRVADPKPRVAKRDVIKHYASLLTPVGLVERMNQPVRVLSGGERQLLALVIAKLRAIPVVLLDEPLAALDPRKVQLCVEEIAGIHRDGTTIIQVAHDTRAIEMRADRIITLKEGRVSSVRDTEKDAGVSCEVA